MRSLTFAITMAMCTATFAQEQTDFAWLTGTWVGPGFGGTFEETWSEPDANGQLMGMFRYTDSSGSVQFYEFWILNGLGLKLKHFNPDFTGWEEKADYIDFKMVETTSSKITLKGLIYERLSENQMKVSLKIRTGDQVNLEIFNLKRTE